jgi:hypothetical protein
LLHRLGATLLNVAAVAWRPLHARARLLRHLHPPRAHRLLDESLPTKIVATTSNATSRDHRFTDERIAELGRLPGVSSPFRRWS